MILLYNTPRSLVRVSAEHNALTSLQLTLHSLDLGELGATPQLIPLPWIGWDRWGGSLFCRRALEAIIMDFG